MIDRDRIVDNVVVCPWCQHRHSDSWEFNSGSHECHRCEQPFDVTVERSVTYTTWQAERKDGDA